MAPIGLLHRGSTATALCKAQLNRSTFPLLSRQQLGLCLPILHTPCAPSTSGRYSQQRLTITSASRKATPTQPATLATPPAPAAAAPFEAVAPESTAVAPDVEVAVEAAAPVEGDLPEGHVVVGPSEAVLHPVLTETDEVVTEVVEEVRPVTWQGVAERSQHYLTQTTVGKGIVVGVVAFLLGTLGVAIWNTYQKANTSRAKRLRQVDRNLVLVEGINAYLPARRTQLTQGVLRNLRTQAGYTPVEVFRKYLWYLLRERKFDQPAVDDLEHLKTTLGLTDADVGEALKERATRIYDKFGTLMMNTEGLTLAGAQRKAACTALFRKMLYLVECGRLVETGGTGADVSDLRTIFGATEEDLEKLRIKNLYEDEEVDLEATLLKDAYDPEDADQDTSSRTTNLGPRPGDDPGSTRA